MDLAGELGGPRCGRRAHAELERRGVPGARRGLFSRRRGVIGHVEPLRGELEQTPAGGEFSGADHAAGRGDEQHIGQRVACDGPELGVAVDLRIDPPQFAEHRAIAGGPARGEVPGLHLREQHGSGRDQVRLADADEPVFEGLTMAVQLSSPGKQRRQMPCIPQKIGARLLALDHHRRRTPADPERRERRTSAGWMRGRALCAVTKRIGIAGGIYAVARGRAPDLGRDGDAPGRAQKRRCERLEPLVTHGLHGRASAERSPLRQLTSRSMGGSDLERAMVADLRFPGCMG